MTTIVSEQLQHCGIPEGYKTWLGVIIGYARGEFNFSESKFAGRFRSVIRVLLARTCAGHITADLFILDEFQRFKMLLDSDTENEESLIAREIFKNREQTRVLLLSATPFKAVTHAEDDEDGGAHSEELDFLLSFLTHSDTETIISYESNRKEMQQQLLQLRDPEFKVGQLHRKNKIKIEQLLSGYLARTERVQISDNYEGLFRARTETCADDFSIKEIEVFKVLDQLGQAIQKASPHGHIGQLMEFYKASPWPLSFLSGYNFKKLLDKHKADKEVRRPFKKSDPAWLSWDAINSYQINIGNAPHAKTRSLIRELFKTPSEQMLWVPPTMPHYPLEGSFKEQESFTKTLLFSSWAMVPRALSGLISYEAERRVHKAGNKEKYDALGKHAPSLRFDDSSSLVSLTLIYPAVSLMNMTINLNVTNLTELLKERASYFKSQLEKLKQYEVGQQRGERWYALAPFLLDMASGFQETQKIWLNDQYTGLKKDKEALGLGRQIESLKSLLADSYLEELKLGTMPADLAEYLALLSIAGPGVVVGRSWAKMWPEEDLLDRMNAASVVAFASISMFNKPSSEYIINNRFPNEAEKYFKKVVRYCAEGDFQAVIDEYVHLLKDSGLTMTAHAGGDSATSKLATVFGMQTTWVNCQFRKDKKKTDENLEKANGKSRGRRNSLRCHYAVPLGNQKMSDDKGLQRIGHIRDAFNSPFRPFMLNSTSIGQEGLDFHWYCHNVVHWNIPSNPIDIEQREGRVNRYKSLVVRKRVVENYAQALNCETSSDCWQAVFDKAEAITKAAGRKSDLVPYWHIEKGSAQIERFVPLLPMSKDEIRINHALRVLALYRLAFGQPRQEDLLDNIIQRQFSPVEIEEIKRNLLINLTPLKTSSQS